MATKFLDYTGLSYLWNKIKTYAGNFACTAAKALGIYFVIPNETEQTATITATITGVTSYFVGLTVALRMPFNTPASATLNINNLGAKPIYYKVNTTSANYYPANAVVLLVYETTTLSTGCFKMVYAYDSNTNNATAQNISTSSNTFPVLIGYTANATANIGNKATYFCKDVKIQPSTGILSANGFVGDVTGDVTGNASTASAVAWSGVTNKPSTFTPSSHNQASNTINAMTGYSKPSSSSAIAASDSLNDAIGKLEVKIDSIDDTDYVHIIGDENITGTKTFVGSKKIAFKQSGANDKLGFTLYNNSDKEQGYLEYNPTNKVSNVPLFTLGNYATAANELTYVGFRRYSSISGASGAYNLLAPLISDAKTPFNLTTTYTNFYLPLGISDGTTIVKASNSGVVDISSLLTLTGYTKPSSGSALVTTDTIKQALGKLEAKVDTAVANSDGIPVGSIVWLSTSTVPTGFLLCNGQAVGRTTYSDLFTAIGTTYGSGDGSTTFNLPNLIDKFIEGTNTNVGTSVNAGLPNIIGSIHTDGVYGSDVFTRGYDAFTVSSNGGWRPNTVQYSLAGAGDTFSFDASRYNNIYGNSVTVQPPALKLLPCIKAYNSVSNISELDAAQLENELQNNYVHLTGDETISGIKEFTDNIHISKIHPNIHISNQALVKGTNPDQLRWNEFLFCDNSRNYTTPYRFGMMGAYVDAEGTTRVMMFAYKWIAGSSDYSGISVFYPKDGTPYTEAPTPESSSDNSSKIATTAWVNSASSVVHTSGNEVINGAKIFTSDITIQYTVNAILQGYTGCLFRTVDKNENPTGHVWIDAPESPTSSGFFQLVLYNNIGSNGIVQLTRDADGQWVFCTTSDRTNTYNLGSPGRKWKTVYAGTGSINTSDIRLKDNITSIPDEILDTWEDVNYCQFKFKDAIKEKGVERSRYHTGVIAQNLDKLFKAKNLDISKYGLFCYDEWDAGFEPNGPDPENKVYYDSDYIYSIRYEETLCMEAAYQRRENKRLKAKISDLEKRLEALELLLKSE